jgi:hypothetical protein
LPSSVPSVAVQRGFGLIGSRSAALPALPITLAGLAVLPVMAVVWLVMAAVAVMMFAVMMVVDAGSLLLRGRPAQQPRLRFSLF